MASNPITADWMELMRQAPMSVAHYIGPMIREIDHHFGAGYAGKHPELLGALVAACATEYHSACVSLAGQDIAESINALCNTIRDEGGWPSLSGLDIDGPQVKT